LEILDDLLKEQSEIKSLFYLVKNVDGEIAGRMNLVDLNWQEKTGEVGYRISEFFSGKGAVSSVLELIMNEARSMGIEC
jgi:[ribosomal protein S5]-alanine N-acetyltransferase